jgi:excisionase family DNA binding protein
MLRREDVPAVTAAEAADMLGVTPRHVRRLVREGRLRGWRVGSSWVLPVHEVAHYAVHRGWCNRYGIKGGSRA